MSKSIIRQKRILTKAGGGSSLATPVSVANGGTGISSYAIGDLIIASGATTLSKLASPAIGQFLLSGGVGAAPDYSGTNLTFDKATSTFSIKTTAGDEWFFVEPTNNTIALGDIDSSGNGSTLVIDNTNQKITWNKSIFGIGGVEYTFPAANASGVLTNNGSGTLSWAAASPGITVGTTTITGGTTRNIPYNLAGVYQEASKDLYYQLATPYAHVFAAGRSGTITGARNSAFGYNAAFSLTSGTDNTAFGFDALYGVSTTNFSTAIGSSALENSTGASNTAVGYYSQGIASGAGAHNTSIGANSLRNRTSGQYNVALGSEALYTNQTGSFNIGIGYQSNYSGTALSGTIGIGYGTILTANNQGVLGSAEAEGFVTNWFFNGVTGATQRNVILNGHGGSGADNAGANFTIATGRGTGSATTGGDFIIQTSDAAASSSTPQTLTTKFTVKKSGSIEIANTVDATAGDTVTINKAAGRFRKDTSGSTMTVTNSLVTANSIILLTQASDSGITGFDFYVVASAGSFIVTFTTSGVAAAPTSNVDMNFLVIN